MESGQVGWDGKSVGMICCDSVDCVLYLGVKLSSLREQAYPFPISQTKTVPIRLNRRPFSKGIYTISHARTRAPIEVKHPPLLQAVR